MFFLHPHLQGSALPPRKVLPLYFLLHHHFSSTATLMVSPWSVPDSLNLPTPMEDSLIRFLAKRTAMGKVASEFFWHSARIARLGP